MQVPQKRMMKKNDPQAHRRQRTKPLFNVIMYHILHSKKRSLIFPCYLITAAMLFRQQKFCSCFKKYDIVENWFESYELILHICLLPS